MAPQPTLYQSLLDEALKVSGKKSKRETVNAALAEYIQRRKQQKLLDLFGRIDFDPNYDYKAARKR